jgi:hypothetical protein
MAKANKGNAATSKATSKGSKATSKAATVGTPTQALQVLFGGGTPSASKLLKYMGASGTYTRKQATAVCLWLLPTTSGSTVGCQFYSGRALLHGNTPTHGGKPGVFTPAGVALLAAICQQQTGTAPAPVAANA